MHVQLTQLPKTQVEFTITVSKEEIQPHIQKAAVHISNARDIKGFRRGKAPYERVLQEVGEMALYETALEHILQESFFNAVKQQNVQTIGAPKIEVKKLAPGNDCVFTATVARMPNIQMPDVQKISVEKKLVDITENEVTEVLENLRKMRASEVIGNHPTTAADKIVIDMDMFVEHVPVEGGQAKSYGVYLNEKNYIPGLPQELIGLKKGDEKTFVLPFPKEHYQKHLAGKQVEFKIKVIDVYTIQLPTLDDAFAKAYGQESLVALRTLLKENLIKEAEQKEEQRQEIEMLSSLVDASTFEEIPEILLNSEKERIWHELTDQITNQGLTMAQYLSDLKKTEQEIRDGFTKQAQKRVHITLLLRALAEEQHISVEPAELEEEKNKIKQTYASEQKLLERLESADVMDSLRALIRNRKVISLLKKQISTT